MKQISPLLLFILLGLSCRLNAQQMALNNGGGSSDFNVYREIDLVTEQMGSSPGNVELYVQRAILYMNAREYEKALEDVDAGLAISPENDKLYSTQAMIYLKKKRFDSALESIDLAVGLAANEKNLFLRANIFSARNELRESILDLNAILKLNPKADYVYLQKAFWCNDLNMYYEEILNYFYYIGISKDEINVGLIKKRLTKMKKADSYYKGLIHHAKKQIKKEGYPWDYHVWQ